MWFHSEALGLNESLRVSGRSHPPPVAMGVCRRVWAWIRGRSYSTVGGGWKNVASGFNSFIGGGGAQTSDSNGGNVASGSWSAVLGGSFNTAKGMYVVAGPCTVSLEVQAAANLLLAFGRGEMCLHAEVVVATASWCLPLTPADFVLCDCRCRLARVRGHSYSTVAGGSANAAIES